MLKSTLATAALLGAISAGAPAYASTVAAVDTGWQFSDPSVSGSFHDVFDFDLSTAGTVYATYCGTPSTLSLLKHSGSRKSSSMRR